MRRGRRRRREVMAEPFGDCKPAGEEPNGGGFHVALAAGDLTGKAQARLGVEPQGAIEELRRVEEGVAVKAAEAREFGPLEARNGAEEAGLLAVLELRSEEHTSELQSRGHLVCRLLLEK